MGRFLACVSICAGLASGGDGKVGPVTHFVPRDGVLGLRTIGVRGEDSIILDV
jgi:hypothetical protein